jgi:hypothetical protein
MFLGIFMAGNGLSILPALESALGPALGQPCVLY